MAEIYTDVDGYDFTAVGRRYDHVVRPTAKIHWTTRNERKKGYTRCSRSHRCHQMLWEKR